MISNDTLFDIYMSVHTTHGWYAYLCNGGVLSNEQLNTMLWFDETTKSDMDLYYGSVKVMKNSIFEFVEETYRDDEEWCDECRLRYLSGVQSDLEGIICDILQTYSKQRDDGTTDEQRQFNFILSDVEKYKTRLSKIENEIHFLKNKKEYEANRITPIEIERAEQYPIEDIVHVNKKGFASCINHAEQNNTPGMFCKNNFAYCYSCGWMGNAIHVYRKVKGCGFVEAVKFLSSRTI